jgi:hypothetical protein
MRWRQQVQASWWQRQQHWMQAHGQTTPQVARLAAGERLTTALIGCTYLMQRGVAADNAFGIVQTMLDAKLSSADFATLQRLVDRDIRAGAPAAEAARLRANALILQRSRLRNDGGA